MRRSVTLAVALIAAMALGRAITDHLPIGNVSSRPFVRTGRVDHALSLRYADVKVTDVRVVAFLGTPSGAAAPAGRFLAVYATITAKRQPQQVGYVGLLGGDGRPYAVTSRGSCSVPGAFYPTGLRYHVMYCFDVPKRALEGSRLELSQGVPGQGGGQARDDVARIALGLSRADVTKGWATTTGLDGFSGGFETADQKSLTLTEGSS
ncbi:hypothetical protein D9V37_04205 [Nocardioides mangrovicus]|uniref:Uncharacterized protein n=1 Tax=Nocardioides mangrovicus TaxID=2478913 RepID=A0A3L8P923_9ACTN|nr:hypothetical protein [Nocardioides mangrovicus]RLV51128.1 hypothetical protein D9V37_04205 [Nocardioides mangrovicus]